MKKITLIVIALFLSTAVISQDAKELKNTFLDAEYYIMYNDYNEALPLYKKLLNEGMNNAYINYRIGECYLNINGQKQNSIPFLENAVQNISAKSKEGSFKETTAPNEAMFLLGVAYHINEDLNFAIECYNNYKNMIDVKDIYNIDYVNNQIKNCENAKVLIETPVAYSKTNMGESINSNFPDIKPVISNNGEHLLFTTKLRFYDAVFHAKRINDSWSAPENLTPQLRTDGNMYSSSLSADGNTLYLFKNDPYNGDIYQSYHNGEKWSIPKELNKNINTKYWETHACVSADGKILYFTSDRKGGFGGLDIYKSIWDEANNDWGEAINMGATINSPFDEETPFICEDGVTLFFSSKGHYNMGGYDIFYSKQVSDTCWSDPINIGYPLNTTDNDLFFQPIKNGQQGYISKFSRKGYGKEDIFLIDLYSQDRPKEITVKGQVYLADNRYEYGKDFYIEVLDSSKVEVVQKVGLHPETGEFSTILKPGTYKFIFQSKEYKRQIKSVYIPIDYTRKDLVVNVELVPRQVTTGKYLTIKNVLFGFDDYSLSRDSRIELERMVNLMKEYPSLSIEVIGHTDAIGASDYNLKLSMKRAQAVVDYLTGKGIKKDRFIAKGAGKSQPIAINTNSDGSDNAEGRKFNRRVEMKILKSDEKLVINENVDIPEHLKDKTRTYCIMLMKSEKELSTDYFNQYNFPSEHKIKMHKNSVFIYTLGNTENKSELIKIFNNVLEQGFDDAEIIDCYDLNDLVNPGANNYKTNTDEKIAQYMEAQIANQI